MEREIDEFYDILEAEPVDAPVATPNAEAAQIEDSIIIELIKGDGNDS